MASEDPLPAAGFPAGYPIHFIFTPMRGMGDVEVALRAFPHTAGFAPRVTPWAGSAGYLRTVIVTAAVYRGFGRELLPARGRDNPLP